jgi:hypothetical protein
MTKPTHRSQRFAQAATSEQSRLVRKRAQLSKKREDLQARIDLLDAELEAVDSEIAILASFTLRDASPAGAAQTATKGSLEPISGSKIRRLAVPLLLRERGTGPIHYREWEALLRRDGFQVAGKRPDAVFLNQVTRSPLVRSTTRAGYYELDLDVPERLRKRLRQQQTKLSTLMIDPPTDAPGFERQQEAQRELNAAIGRTQRELEEAVSALEDVEEDPSSKAQAA